jgi:hypothetical protein
MIGRYTALAFALAALALAGCDVETDAGSAGGGSAGGDCHPSYEGACLDPSSPDYDCAGGSGNGPDYTGYVRIVGSDDYGLDGDGDGEGCE